VVSCSLSFMFSTSTATPHIYTLSLHDALPISHGHSNLYPTSGSFRRRIWISRFVNSSIVDFPPQQNHGFDNCLDKVFSCGDIYRSEEHTSELQSRGHLVFRLLLEKKKKKRIDL